MDPFSLVLIALFAVLIFFMFRNNKKRQREAQELRNSVVVGAEVMTNFGLYGTVTEIDDDEHIVWIESTPGTVVRVHQQAVARVITPTEPEENADEIAGTDSSVTDDSVEPQYGEKAVPTETEEPGAGGAEPDSGSAEK